MARNRKNDLQKKTLNFRPGDFDKMGEMFPDLGPSVAIRELVSRFVDRYYETSAKVPPVTDLEL